MVVILSPLVRLAGHIFWQALHSELKEGSVVPGISYCLLAQLVLMLESSFCLKHCRHFWLHSFLRMPCPRCSIEKLLSQLINLNPHSSLKSQIMHYNHIISNPTLTGVPHLPSSPFVLPHSHMDAFHLFLSEARGTPAYLHSGCPLANEHRVSLFPTVHFVRLTMSLWAGQITGV